MTAPPPGKKSLMRSLGEFFGHIAHGVAGDVSRRGTPPVTVERREETREATSPDGSVVLRRTTIEEVEFRPVDGGPPRPPVEKSGPPDR